MVNVFDKNIIEKPDFIKNPVQALFNYANYSPKAKVLFEEKN